MAIDIKALNPTEAKALSAELARRKVKFLPRQAILRAVDPAGAKMSPLGASVRDKAKRIAARDSAIRQAATAKDAAAQKASGKK